jgi:hypothetical protein
MHSVKHNRNTEEMGKYDTKLAHGCRSRHCIAHFIRISWWGEETKCTSSKKDPGENTGAFLLFRQKMYAILAPASVLAFFPIPKASLTSEESGKKLR